MASSFIPALWSGAILNGLLKSLVYGSLCNSKYEGEIKQAGDRVIIGEIGDITVSPYVKNSTPITYQELTDASKTLVIDQSKYFAFSCDDVDRVQSKLALITAATGKAAYALKDEIDQFVASKYTDAGITADLGDDSTPLEINSANVIETLLLIGRKMDENNVPRGNRWAVVPPWMYEDLVYSDINVSTNNQGSLNNGFVGPVVGFNLYVSNNVPNTTSTKYKIMAGISDAICLAMQIQNVEQVRRESSFSSGVRGLALYGAKVILPAALACATVNEAAEAS